MWSEEIAVTLLENPSLQKLIFINEIYKAGRGRGGGGGERAVQKMKFYISQAFDVLL